ncbi:DNA-processing protein DprA [Microgenomates group bacterium]|nr:DNA-processing protein DprA [Microgenomates group bacterium]
MFDIQPTIIRFEQKNYPALLREIKDPPAKIYVYGREEILQRPWPVAMVGARMMTEYGQRAARKIAGELAGLGVVVVSGLMYGIDTEAQVAAMEGGGESIGVLGFGVNNFFPSTHEQLAKKWIRRGNLVLVSEYPPEVFPQPWTFLQRNRIVAGLSKAVVVVEAAAQSGSLVTARLAGECGREVMAVSGGIFNKFAEGTKNLLNQGALLVSSGEDIKQEITGRTYRGRVIGIPKVLKIEDKREAKKKVVGWKREEVSELGWRIGELLKKYKQGLTSDELQKILGARVEELQIELMELELGCKVKLERNNYVLF